MDDGTLAQEQRKYMLFLDIKDLLYANMFDGHTGGVWTVKVDYAVDEIAKLISEAITNGDLA